MDIGASSQAVAPSSHWGMGKLVLFESPSSSDMEDFPPATHRLRLDYAYQELQAQLSLINKSLLIPAGVEDTVDRIISLMDDFTDVMSVFSNLYDDKQMNWFKEKRAVLIEQGLFFGRGKAYYEAGKNAYSKNPHDDECRKKAFWCFEQAVAKGCKRGYLGMALLVIVSKAKLSKLQGRNMILVLDQYKDQSDDAALALGVFLYDGRYGASIDRKKAFKLLRPFASYHSVAQLYLARMCMRGDGCKQSTKIAHDLLWKSTTAGNRIAQEYLDEWFG